MKQQINGRTAMKKVLFGTMLATLALMAGLPGTVIAEDKVPAAITEIPAADLAYETAPETLAGIPAVEYITREPARYNLATVQGNRNLNVIPGTEATAEICFYNVDGNRTTHIRLEAIEVPAGWVVEINPVLHEEQVNLAGQMVTVVENLHVDPAEILAEKTVNTVEGTKCITLGTRGYTIAKVVTITIHVPETEAAGIEGKVKITAEAGWLGQTGQVTVKQTRDFEFNVVTR